eukprot:TRINITY_DN4490_c0_g2_i1.p1 TRINITY_DN4490_c0_g2~~TRINITY_DN4490_c0_g2_i1.p1  ORF type:complete len:379 (-),score=51.91 TRINITY_DN4490_c0_g2_i1:277-1413(-)
MICCMPINHKSNRGSRGSGGNTSSNSGDSDNENAEDAQVARERSKRIDQKIKLENKAVAPIKLLLLGAGDVGKTTFLKQLIILHGGGFSGRDVEKFKLVLQDNCLNSMQKILYTDKLPWPDSFESKKKAIIESTSFQDVASIIKDLWKSDESSAIIKKIIQNAGVYDLNIISTASYMFDNVERFMSKDFVPTEDDILRAKEKTRGVNEVDLKIGNHKFTIVDVGGQRSERRKWIHCFDDVTSVIFLASLDEYDMVIEEEAQRLTNRLHESINLFSQITSSLIFQPSTSWILLLNKCDLFKEKIKSVPLTHCFPKMPEEDAQDYDKCCQYIYGKFKRKFSGKTLYSHVTCALDTKLIGKVFGVVRETILSNALNNYGYS